MAEEKNKAQQQQAQNQNNIELTEEIAEGIYSNLAMIAHSNSEFVIDFIRLMGMKENVIVGHLIPAGTGQRRFNELIVTHKDEYNALTSAEPTKKEKELQD